MRYGKVRYLIRDPFCKPCNVTTAPVLVGVRESGKTAQPGCVVDDSNVEMSILRPKEQSSRQTVRPTPVRFRTRHPAVQGDLTALESQFVGQASRLARRIATPPLLYPVRFGHNFGAPIRWR